jgi:hypothetical protein
LLSVSASALSRSSSGRRSNPGSATTGSYSTASAPELGRSLNSGARWPSKTPSKTLDWNV